MPATRGRNIQIGTDGAYFRGNEIFYLSSRGLPLSTFVVIHLSFSNGDVISCSRSLYIYRTLARAVPVFIFETTALFSGL